MKKRVLVVGWSSFRRGFELIFNDKSNFEFIHKEHGWDKMSVWQRINYAKHFDVIHYYWAKVRFSEIIFMKLIMDKIFFQFIGSDVILVSETKRRRLEQKFFYLLGVKYFAVHQNLINELEDIGLHVKLLLFANNILKNNLIPLPEKFSVLAYVPQNKERFYQMSLIEETARKIPDIKFTIIPNNKNFLLPNIISVPYNQDILSEINKCSVFIRLTEHDGMPNTILEALSCARHVIWSFKHEHCYQANTVDELVQILTRLKQENSLNTEGREFVLKNYSIDRIRENFYEVWGIM